MSQSRGLCGQVVLADGCQVVQRLVIVPSFLDFEQVHFLSRPLVAIEKPESVSVEHTTNSDIRFAWGLGCCCFSLLLILSLVNTVQGAEEHKEYDFALAKGLYLYNQGRIGRLSVISRKR